MTRPRILLRPKPTARELLVHVAGDDHSSHSVIERRRPLRGTIAFTCSCGEVFKVPNEGDVTVALRNVTEAGGMQS